MRAYKATVTFMFGDCDEKQILAIGDYLKQEAIKTSETIKILTASISLSPHIEIVDEKGNEVTRKLPWENDDKK